MKKLTSTLALTGLLALPTQADVIFAAPGMDTAQSFEGLNIQSGYSTHKKIEIKDYWSYEITGITWQLSAGVPYDGKLGSNGMLQTPWSTAYPGSSTLTLSDGHGWLIPSARFPAWGKALPFYISDKSTGSVKFAKPKSYPPHAKTGHNITFDLRQITNMKQDGGSFVRVQGVAIKGAPGPYGSLDVTPFVKEGAKPIVNWVLGREDSTGTAPSIPSSTVNWTPELTPGESLASPSVSGSSHRVRYSRCGRATNCGAGRTHNIGSTSNSGTHSQAWNAPTRRNRGCQW